MKPNFQKLLSRKHAVLTDDILIRSWNDEKRFKKIAKFNDYVKNLEIIDGDFYFDMNWMEAVAKKYQNKPLNFFWDFTKNGYVNGEKLISFSRKLKINKTNLSKLENDFWISVELLKNLLVFLPQTHPLAKSIEDKLIDILKKKGIEESEMNGILINISKPEKMNSPVLEEIDLRRIKNHNYSEVDLDQALKKHLNKYSFLGYREPFSKGYDFNFFKKKLEELDLNNKKYGTIKNRFKFDKKEEEFMNLMKEFVYFRNYRTEKLYEALFYLETLWNEIGKKFLVKENDLGYYLLSEIKDLFEKNIKVSNKIIKERKLGHGFLLHDNKIELLFGKKLIQKINSLNISAIHDIKELKGMVACSGKIKGTVRIILKASEQSKVSEGDILITTMTTPDFMPCMKKAVAFVTDEGGITCHAAIVAREWNKPCIIGTKIATKILKDGDLVEVDANKGIVKILKN